VQGYYNKDLIAMKFTAALTAICIASASAFAPATVGRVSSSIILLLSFE